MELACASHQGLSALRDARTTAGERCVPAHRGRAGEKLAFATFSLIRVIRLPAVRIRPLAAYDQRLRPAAIHTLVERRSKIQLTVQIHRKRKIEGETDEFILARL